MDLIAWLAERAENCARIGRTKFGSDRRGWEDDERYFRQAIAELSAHRRSVRAYEEEARAWLQRQDKDWSYFTSKESLASLLATVHKAAIEKAAAITGAPVTEAEISAAWKDEDGPAIINHVNAARAAALRSKAKEGG